MSIRGPRATVAPRAIHPALPLGHAEVRWDALPRTVQDEVLARWCELLRTVIAPASSSAAVPHDTVSLTETLP